MARKSGVLVRPVEPGSGGELWEARVPWWLQSSPQGHSSQVCPEEWVKGCGGGHRF